MMTDNRHDEYKQPLTKADVKTITYWDNDSALVQLRPISEQQSNLYNTNLLFNYSYFEQAVKEAGSVGNQSHTSQGRK